ncbi:MAG: HPr family phosphocarrier protein [Eubacteriales bacterium]
MSNEFQVAFRSVEEISDFVNLANQYPVEMDLSRGKYVVDAKSIIGMLNLGIHNELNLIVHGDMTTCLRQAIDTFVVA